MLDAAGVGDLTSNLEHMGLNNHDQRQPTQEEVDACLDALENEVPQNRAPTQPRQAQRLREESCADPGGLLWFILLVGIGFFAWLVSTMGF